jgi:hypothetical protein
VGRPGLTNPASRRPGHRLVDWLQHVVADWAFARLTAPIQASADLHARSVANPLPLLRDMTVNLSLKRKFPSGVARQNGALVTGVMLPFLRRIALASIRAGTSLLSAVAAPVSSDIFVCNLYPHRLGGRPMRGSARLPFCRRGVLQETYNQTRASYLQVVVV